jgi:hypothetical protein
MHVNMDHAAYIYARACRSWYGRRASRIVKKRIGELKKVGDAKGVQAWSLVADKLSYIDRRPAEHEAGKLY